MTSKLLLALAAAGISLAACADLERGDPPPPKAIVKAADKADTDTTDSTTKNPTTDSTTTETGLSFAADVLPVLVDKCTQCHGPNNSTAYKLSGDADTDYPVVVALTNDADPADSQLLKKGSAQVSHGGGQVIETESPEFETILQWVADGAKP